MSALFTALALSTMALALGACQGNSLGVPDLTCPPADVHDHPAWEHTHPICERGED